MLTVTKGIDFIELRCRVQLALVTKLVKIIQRMVSQRGIFDSSAVAIVSEELLLDVLTASGVEEDTPISLLYRIDFIGDERWKIEIRHLSRDGRYDRKKLRNAIEGSATQMLSKMIVFDSDGKWVVVILDMQPHHATKVTNRSSRDRALT